MVAVDAWMEQTLAPTIVARFSAALRFRRIAEARLAPGESIGFEGCIINKRLDSNGREYGGGQAVVPRVLRIAYSG